MPGQDSAFLVSSSQSGTLYSPERGTIAVDTMWRIVVRYIHSRHEILSSQQQRAGTMIWNYIRKKLFCKTILEMNNIRTTGEDNSPWRSDRYQHNVNNDDVYLQETIKLSVQETFVSWLLRKKFLETKWTLLSEAIERRHEYVELKQTIFFLFVKRSMSETF